MRRTEPEPEQWPVWALYSSCQLTFPGRVLHLPILQWSPHFGVTGGLFGGHMGSSWGSWIVTGGHLGCHWRAIGDHLRVHMSLDVLVSYSKFEFRNGMWVYLIEDHRENLNKNICRKKKHNITFKIFCWWFRKDFKNTDLIWIGFAWGWCAKIFCKWSPFLAALAKNSLYCDNHYCGFSNTHLLSFL